MVLEIDLSDSDRPNVVSWDTKAAKLVHIDGNYFFDSDAETLQSSSESNNEQVPITTNERKYSNVEGDLKIWSQGNVPITNMPPNFKKYPNTLIIVQQS